MEIDAFNEALHPSAGRSTSDPAREVFILGAGFSKQISSHMPLLKELSEAIAVRVPELGRIGAVPFLTTDVEMAMTFLSQPQPWRQKPKDFAIVLCFWRLPAPSQPRLRTGRLLFGPALVGSSSSFIGCTLGKQL